MIRTPWSLFALLVALALPVPAAAAPVTLDFDGLTDSDLVTDQFAALGVTFENAIVSTFGVSLDPFLHDAPVSGDNVLSDFGGSMRLIFGTTPAFSFSGFFNYAEPLTINAYFGGALVATAASAFDRNLLDTTNPSNELLILSGVFDEIVISGVEFGGFTVDNLTFDNEPSAVAEPGTLALMVLGGAAAFVRRRRMRT